MKYNFLVRAMMIIALILPRMGEAQCSDFITVDGKKLKCGQNDFFSVGVNYVVQIMHNNETDGTAPYDIRYHYPSRAHMYSADNRWTPEINNRTEAYNGIVKDFTDMKNLGINTVRIAGIGYEDLSTLSADVSITSQLYHTSSDFNKLLLDVHADVLKAASLAGLKVVMLLSKGPSHCIPYPWYMGTTTNPAPPVSLTDGYINYLKLFSARFKNDPTLMAIDFVNEPDLTCRENKNTICQLTKTWNDAVKSQSNILTTIGLWSNSCTSWDANMLNIDFVSFHNYPYVEDASNLSDLPDAINRIKSDYWWMKNNVKIPWLIGETGLEAHKKNLTHPINATANWSRPHTSGTLTDQGDYLFGTLNASRDCGASGYTWWTFMDEHVHSTYPYGLPSAGPFWGLAYSNEGNTPIVWKPAASYIQGFVPTLPGTPSQPANYYNYFNTPSTTGKYAYGNVRTTDDIPIKDAIIEIHDVDGKIYNTYSDANGNYTIYAGNNINLIKISATECSSYSEATGTSGLPIWQKSVQLTKIDRSIASTLFYANINVVGVAVNDHADTYASFINYKIYNSNFHVTASNYIRLNTGTSIYPENDFSATIGNFYHNCSSIVNNSNQAFRQNNSTTDTIASKMTSTEDKKTAISNLNSPPEHEVSIFPSPSDGKLVVKTPNDKMKEIIVRNTLGETIMVFKSNSPETHLNLDLAPAIYVIQITIESQTTQQKIIIQK